jgi:hypothetical protein
LRGQAADYLEQYDKVLDLSVSNPVKIPGALAQWRDGDLRDHVLDALTGGNAARLLGRD